MPRNVAKGVRNRGVRQFSEICFSAEGIHVALLTHPHFVRVSALRATTGLAQAGSVSVRKANHDRAAAIVCGCGGGHHFAIQQNDPCVLHFGRSFPGHIRQGAQMLRLVSQSTGVSTRTHLFGRAWGTFMSEPILRCRPFIVCEVLRPRYECALRQRWHQGAKNVLAIN